MAALRQLWEGGAFLQEVMAALPRHTKCAIQRKAHDMMFQRPDWYISKVRAAACRAGNYGGRKRR